jgi:hypothetical protein
MVPLHPPAGTCCCGLLLLRMACVSLWVLLLLRQLREWEWQASVVIYG